MNEQIQIVSPSLSCQTHEILNAANELEVFVFYTHYTLSLLQKKQPAEMHAQICRLLDDIEQSMVEASVKDKIVTELRGLMHQLLYSNINTHYQASLERILSELRSWMRG